MVGLVNLARRYLMVTTTLAVGLLGIVLALAGAGASVQWVFSGYALGVAAWHAVGMVRDILRGRWGWTSSPSWRSSRPWWSASTSQRCSWC